MEGIIRKHIEDILASRGIAECSFSVEHPALLSHGDYATNVALVAAKLLGTHPNEVAELLVKELEGKIAEVERLDIAGPGFINIHLTRDFFKEKITGVLTAGDRWGQSSLLQGKTWVIEHTSPNPNKAMHIGHLRNNIIGMALVRLAEASGAIAVSEAVDNNRGIAIAKLMWGYLKFGRRDGAMQTDIAYWVEHQDEWQTPEEQGVRPDRFVDALYVMGNQDGEENPENQQKIRQLVIDWENENEQVWALWRKVLSYSYAGQAMTLKRLQSRWDRVWHEHEHYKEGKRFVEQGLHDGVFVRLEDGAILTHLDAMGLSNTIVQKSDGTALYITQDIALTKLKKDAGADKLIWVIGPDQSLAMQQLFAVCEQLGIGSRSEFIHIAYGYMSVRGQGRMSSRKGTVLYIDDVIDATKNKVREILKGREISDVEAVAEHVALAALKYSIVRSGRLRDISFDIEEATRFEGDSGPYLQYAYVRASAVLAKAEDAGIVASLTVAPAEPYTIERMFYRFPEVVREATLAYEPHHVATFLMELAGAFNAFYAEERIVDSADVYAPYKVALTDAIRVTLKNGLGLLGIETLEQM